MLAGCGGQFECGPDCFVEGDFSVAVVDRGGSSEQLVVTHRGSPLFASPSGVGWAEVGVGEATVGYASGSFDFDEERITSCTSLTTRR